MAADWRCGRLTGTASGVTRHPPGAGSHAIAQWQVARSAARVGELVWSAGRRRFTVGEVMTSNLLL